MKYFYLFLTFIFCFCACQNNNLDEKDEKPTQMAEGLIISESTNGQSEWKLKAKKAFFYENNQVVMESPFVVFNENLSNEVTLQGKEGKYLTNGLIMLENKVIAKAPKENLILKSQKLYYDSNTKQIWTDVAFTLQRNGIKVSGTALKTDNTFSEIEIFKQTTESPSNLRELENSIKGLENLTK